MSSSVKNKTRRRRCRGSQRGGEPAGRNLHKVLLTLLNFVNTIKLYHWRTLSYSEHKATDEFYESLQTHIDKFIEVLLGRRKDAASSRITEPAVFNITANNFKTKDQLFACVDRFRAFLIDLDKIMNRAGADSDLLNIRDEILADTNKFMYLIRAT
jgi:DNA-binding ferritin-like protein